MARDVLLAEERDIAWVVLEKPTSESPGKSTPRSRDDLVSRRSMETLFRDLRYAARRLRRTPGFTVFATLTLAVGIGANSAIFAIVNGIILRPLPFLEPDRLVMVWQNHSAVDGPDQEWASPPNFLDWREQSESFAAMAAVSGWFPTLTEGPAAERLEGIAASHDIFPVLGVGLPIGRGFLPGEDEPGGDRVIVISHDMWQRSFAGVDDIVGRKLHLDGTPYTIVGVMPSGFRFVALDGLSADPQVWTPIQLDPDACGRGCLTLRVMGRLTDDVDVAGAQAEMSGIAERLEEYPENRGVGSSLIPLHQQVVGEIRPALMILLGAVGFVLLIACANVANLLLARGADRAGELAVRVMLGAPRRRLAAQLMTESVLLALSGGIGGVLLAFWGVDLLLNAVPVGMTIPGLEQVGIDGRVLAFALVVSVITGLAFGVIPSVQATQAGFNTVLKDGARGSTVGPRNSRVRATLVVIEVATAIVLLVGAGLLMKSFVRLMQVDRGFDEHNVLTMSLTLPATLYRDPSDVRSTMMSLVERTSTIRGVDVAGAGSTIPLGGGDSDADFRIDGRAEPEIGDPPRVAWYRQVTPGYLEALRIPVLAGRGIVQTDRADAPHVVVINESLARLHWPSADPIGRYLIFGEREFRIVGIAGDIRNWGLSQSARPAVYLSYEQLPARTMSIVVRTEGNPTDIAAALRHEITEVDPTLAPSSVATLEGVVAASVGQHRLTTLLLGIFSAAALGLAAIGLYGVLSYTVTRRRREIGIRIALGASAARVRAKVVGQGLTLAAFGTIVGLVASLGLTRMASSLLFGVTATDPAIFATVPLLLSVVAMVASYIPAMDASRVDPATALRAE